MIQQSAAHIYRTGETVLLQAGLRYYLKSDATFTVVAQLPALGNELQYRIKSLKEPYERVVLEHQIMLESEPAEGAIAGVFRERAPAGF